MEHQLQTLAEECGDEAIPGGVGLLQRARHLLLQCILLDHHASRTICKRSVQSSMADDPTATTWISITGISARPRRLRSHRQPATGTCLIARWRVRGHGPASAAGDEQSRNRAGCPRRLRVPRTMVGSAAPCGCGEIGRRAGLKIPFRKECRFEPDHPHHICQLLRRAAWVSAPRSPVPSPGGGP